MACPPEYPNLCNKTNDCGGGIDQCCQQDCSTKGGNAPCPAPSPLEAFEKLAGKGKCVDKDGMDDYAAWDASYGATATSLASKCAKDANCVAFSYFENIRHGRLYTSTNCKYDCSRLSWLKNPELIIGTESTFNAQAEAGDACYVKKSNSSEQLRSVDRNPAEKGLGPFMHIAHRWLQIAFPAFLPPSLPPLSHHHATN